MSCWEKAAFVRSHQLWVGLWGTTGLWGGSWDVWKELGCVEGSGLRGRSRAAADGLCPHTQPRELQELVRLQLQGLFELFCGAEWVCSSRGDSWVVKVLFGSGRGGSKPWDLSFAEDFRGTRSVLLGNGKKRGIITICSILEFQCLISSKLGKVEILVLSTKE